MENGVAAQQSMSEVLVDQRVLGRLQAMLDQQVDYIDYQDQPLLCSLLCALAIHQEMGGQNDRLSELLSVNASELQSSTLVRYQGAYGVLLRYEKPVRPISSEVINWLKVVDSTENELRSVLICPIQVAQVYQRRGLKLVVSKRWALRQVINAGGLDIDYQSGNARELIDGDGYYLVELLSEKRVLFLGTHDLADHLLGATPEGLLSSFALAAKLLKSWQKPSKNDNRFKAITTYMIGMLLDDLIQPRWYGAKTHAQLIEDLRKTKSMTSLKIWQNEEEVVVANAFHEILNLARIQGHYNEPDLLRLLNQLGEEIGSTQPGLSA